MIVLEKAMNVLVYGWHIKGVGGVDNMVLMASWARLRIFGFSLVQNFSIDLNIFLVVELLVKLFASRQRSNDSKHIKIWGENEF